MIRATRSEDDVTITCTVPRSQIELMRDSCEDGYPDMAWLYMKAMIRAVDRLDGKIPPLRKTQIIKETEES